MSRYTLKFSKSFKKSFSKLEKRTKKQIENSIKKFASNYLACNVVKLSGTPNTYRLRSGDYRIIFEKNDEELIFLFIDVKHRKDVYRNL